MTFTCHMLTSLNIREEYTIQLPSYSTIFHLQLKSYIKLELKDYLLNHAYSIDDFTSIEKF
jgi:hypothetical protein